MQNGISIFIKLQNILRIFINIKNITIVMIGVSFSGGSTYMYYLCAKGHYLKFIEEGEARSFIDPKRIGFMNDHKIMFGILKSIAQGLCIILTLARVKISSQTLFTCISNIFI